MVYITHIRTRGGPEAEQVTEVVWHEATSGTSGVSTIAHMLEFIAKGNRVRVLDETRELEAVIASPERFDPRTLLSLPRYATQDPT